MRTSVALLLIFAAANLLADDTGYEFNGHTKLRLIGQWYPADSVFTADAGSESLDLESDLRLNFSASNGRWRFDTAYQLFALHGDTVASPNDDRRLFDLSDVIHEEGRTIVAQRLDRLWVGYANDKAVVRFGRQALSWGNGLFYAPMDLVNPFNPAAIDTEFKSGDDMLYMQYLRDSGDDLQAAIVFRRDPISGDVESDQATATLKYHHFAGDKEYDILIGDSYGDTVLGIGAAGSVGGAILRADLVVTDTSGETYVQVVSNLSYSWSWGGKNVSGAVEYYFNGFGQHDSQYDPASLAQNPDLLERLSRSELFTAGRNYLAGSMMIELLPLWSVTPTLLVNASDPSALLQLMSSYSLSDNMTFLGSINLPIGPNGSEIGGAEAVVPGQYRSIDWGVFAQLAWYF